MDTLEQTTQLAHRLVALTRNKFFLEAQAELFAENAVNQEPENSGRPSAIGLAAMQQKERAFLNSISEWHQLEVSEPIVTATHFSVKMLVEVTMLAQRRLRIEELIVYEVRDGKIIKEQFFY